MIPWGWSAGELTEAPKTFKDFQGFSDTARDMAARVGLCKTPEERFELAKQQLVAANDDWPEGTATILLSGAFMNMLRCWEQCARDMVRAKLSYADTNTY